MPRYTEETWQQILMDVIRDEELWIRSLKRLGKIRKIYQDQIRHAEDRIEKIEYRMKHYKRHISQCEQTKNKYIYGRIKGD